MLTSGGDAPGLNAVIRGAVLIGQTVHGHDFIGLRDGWRGLIEADTMPLGRNEVKGISKQGGTILGTSRTNPFEGRGGVDRVTEVMTELGIDAIIAIGGEGTLAAAKRLTDAGIRIVGVPKTVDNDLDATDYTFGFDTAVQIATEAMDRLRTTGDAHSRCMVAEVMGRHVGWIALHSGMASGAHAILIPEQRTSMEQIAAWSRAPPRGAARLSSSSRRASRSTRWTILIQSEASTPSAARAWAVSARSSPPSSRSARASRRGRRLSVTFSAAARRAPSTAFSRRAWAWPP